MIAAIQIRAGVKFDFEHGRPKVKFMTIISAPDEDARVSVLYYENQGLIGLELLFNFKIIVDFSFLAIGFSNRPRVG
jgi:hypothetical protein